MEHAEFDSKVARALHRSGRELQAFCAGWFDWNPHSVPPHSYEKWRLADPSPLTDEQAKAAAKAGAVVRRTHADGRDARDVYRFAGYWQWWNGSKWEDLACSPPGEDRTELWSIAPDPSRAVEPEPEDTLLECMRWCADMKCDEVLAESRSTATIMDIDSKGMALTRGGYPLTADALNATDWQLSTDEGATWFSPTRGLPEVEPKSGADLRRWLVSNPGRAVADDAGNTMWWDADECCLLSKSHGITWANPFDSGRKCIPADGGTWESES